MKSIKYFLAVLMGTLLMTACSNADDPVAKDTDNGLQEKTILLKLPKILAGSSTKSIDDKTASGTVINLYNMRILLTDGTNIYQTIDLTSSDAGFTDAIGASGYRISHVDPAVNQVMVLGNHIGENQIVYTNVASVKGSTMNINIEQDKDNILLYGEANLLATTPLPSGATEYYTATVNLASLAARIEIGKIQCTDLGTMYSSFDLRTIGLVDMRQSIFIDGSNPTPRLSIYDGTTGQIYEPGTTGPVGGYMFGNSSPISWSYDVISPAHHFTSSANSYYASGLNTKVFGYQFVPVLGEFPNVKLRLQNVTPVGGGSTSLQWVSTKQFSGLNLAEHPKGGYIYQFDLVFNESNIGTYVPGTNVVADIRVTVDTWQIQAITPIFH